GVAADVVALLHDEDALAQLVGHPLGDGQPEEARADDEKVIRGVSVHARQPNPWFRHGLSDALAFPPRGHPPGGGGRAGPGSTGVPAGVPARVPAGGQSGASRGPGGGIVRRLRGSAGRNTAENTPLVTPATLENLSNIGNIRTCLHIRHALIDGAERTTCTNADPAALRRIIMHPTYWSTILLNRRRISAKADARRPFIVAVVSALIAAPLVALGGNAAYNQIQGSSSGPIDPMVAVESLTEAA